MAVRGMERGDSWREGAQRNRKKTQRIIATFLISALKSALSSRRE